MARSAQREAFQDNGSAWFVLGATAEPALASLRFRLKDVKIFAAEEPFEVDGRQIQRRLVPHPFVGKSRQTSCRSSSRPTASLGLHAHAVGSEIKVKRHPVSVPRIALLHTWVNTQNDGWFRLALDECEVPYSYISDQDVRATPDLKAKYDVIIFPPVTSSLPTLINGVRKRLLDDGSDFGGPVPFKSTELTPNLGGVDDSDDIRGGLGFEGLAHLKTFVEKGGVFVPITASAALPVGLGMVEHVTIAETRQLQASGSVLRAGVQDKTKPDRLRLRRHGRALLQPGPGLPGLAGRWRRLRPGRSRRSRRRDRRPADGPRVGDRPRHSPRSSAPRVRARAHARPGRARAAHRARDARVPRRHDPARSGCGRAWSSAGPTKKTSGSAACSRAAPSSRARPP